MLLLFSGGCNDIVGNRWRSVTARNRGAATGRHSFRNGRSMPAPLALVRAAYEDLIALRARLSPTTQLVFQGYDFAIPDGAASAARSMA